MKALASRGGVDAVSQQMASHPQYLESFLRTQHYILHMDGPLPLEYRHYIAIMVRPLDTRCTFALHDAQKRVLYLRTAQLHTLAPTPLSCTETFTRTQTRHNPPTHIDTNVVNILESSLLVLKCVSVPPSISPRLQRSITVATWCLCTRPSSSGWGGTRCGYRGWRPSPLACNTLTNSTRFWPTNPGSPPAHTYRYHKNQLLEKAMGSYKNI